MCIVCPVLWIVVPHTHAHGPAAVNELKVMLPSGMTQTNHSAHLKDSQQ